MSNNLLADLQSYEGDDMISLLRDMFDSKNIEMKSNFISPIVISQMRLFADACDVEHYPKTAKFVRSFVSYFEKDVVSKDGTGRSELYDAVSGLMKEDYGFKDKLLGREEKMK
jgi:hypothetical protein